MKVAINRVESANLFTKVLFFGKKGGDKKIFQRNIVKIVNKTKKEVTTMNKIELYFKVHKNPIWHSLGKDAGKTITYYKSDKFIIRQNGDVELFPYPSLAVAREHGIKIGSGDKVAYIVFYPESRKVRLINPFTGCEIDV